ncbi:MAG TPA: CDP-diacylglycerol--glycerol-3-phosphate 3-phosphatidyltransferase [Firmicutes bacterium]|jgi:CDP-diacylglycerol--glycerol-3-phosphate 3-phosphatidyltransferase|nr:CDP-diacylglycerol--glycerol-3-phosphate 3-phosphatidyltransferase [Bacillota bacterium]
MSLANFFTWLRILLTPVLVGFLFLSIPYKQYFAAGVFILACLTDGLDGYFARIRREVTPFGKFLDPLADKILIGAALISLWSLHKVSGWVVFLILGREILITILRVFASRRGISVAASIWGKVKTVTQIPAVLWLILDWPGATILLGVAVFFTLYSAFDYIIKWRRLLAGEKRTRVRQVPPT